LAQVTICSGFAQVKLEGDINQGVAYYKKALYYNWHYADAMYNLGVAYGEMLKFDMVSQKSFIYIVFLETLIDPLIRQLPFYYEVYHVFSQICYLFLIISTLWISL